MATNSSTTTRRRSSDEDTTSTDTDRTRATSEEAVEIPGAPAAITYAGNGNTRGTELNAETHGNHRRDTPTDI